MAGTRVITAVALTAGTPTPVYTGAVIVAASFSISKGIATIVLGSALPSNGYNPGTYPSAGAQAGSQAGGQQVTLWGFTTATYFNGLTVSVVANNSALNSFSFNTTHADVTSTSDTGNTAAAPSEHYRAVRLEVDQGAGSGKVYVGDLNVSSTRYAECLVLTGQIAVTIASGDIPADRIMCDTSANGTKIQVSLQY
jgi:hypothetical protein